MQLNNFLVNTATGLPSSIFMMGYDGSHVNSKSNFRAKFTHALLLYHLPNRLSSHKYIVVLLELRENIDRLENKQI